MRRRPSTFQSGFTLIEAVILLAVAGLMVGAVLEAQQLIASARVHDLIARQERVKAAYFGFIDRYRALPGDYSQAYANIPGVAINVNGNGNGKITPAGTDGATIDEHIAAWDHLSKAGFLTTIYQYAPAPETTASTPVNAYSAYLRLVFDGQYGPATSSPKHNLKTGNRLPPDLLAAVDRKLDDGVATTGTFRFSTYNGDGVSPPVGAGSCFANSGSPVWMTAQTTDNCGAASLL